MASRARQSSWANDWRKFFFFGLVGLCFLAVLWVDERFWFDASDSHAIRVNAFRSLLVLHGLTGLTALTAGTLQMSGRIRTRMLWGLIVCALIAPEVIATVSAIARASARKRAG